MFKFRRESPATHPASLLAQCRARHRNKLGVLNVDTDGAFFRSDRGDGTGCVGSDIEVVNHGAGWVELCGFEGTYRFTHVEDVRGALGVAQHWALLAEAAIS